MEKGLFTLNSQESPILPFKLP